jgi:hypothetical protein
MSGTPPTGTALRSKRGNRRYEFVRIDGLWNVEVKSGR